MIFCAFLVGAWVAAVTEPVEPAEIKGADLALVQTVRAIGERSARVSGAPAPLSLLALRADAEIRRAEARRRAERGLPSSRAAARGRAWRDLGFGAVEDPGVLALALAEDLPGMSFDGDGARLLVDPTRLVEDDGTGDHAASQAASLLLATGVAPDEPVVAHYVAHRIGDLAPPAEPMTTDAALARAALAEGSANVAALVYLFSGVGLEAEVLDGKLGPEDVLGGRLVSEAIRSERPIVARLAEFVYLDGFVAAAKLARLSGLRRLPSERAMRRTTRDVLHPERPPAPPSEFSEPPGPAAAGLTLVDRDSLGEQGVVAWVSLVTAKDNLGMIAGDGWAGDALWRFEPAAAGQADAGVTLWESRWLSEEDAKDFAYAVERCLVAQFPSDPIAGAGDEPRVLVRGDRVFRLHRTGRSVTLRIATPPWDLRLDRDEKKKGQPARPASPRK